MIEWPRPAKAQGGKAASSKALCAVAFRPGREAGREVAVENMIKGGSGGGPGRGGAGVFWHSQI